MRKDPDSTDYWLHVSPENSKNFFNTIWKSSCEPVYDPKQRDFVLSDDSLMEGDRYVNVNPNARSLLSLKVRENLRPGYKIHVVNGRCAEIKDINDTLTEPVKHLYDVEETENFEAVRDDDGMIFALNGQTILHERKAFLITRSRENNDVLRVDYVDQSGRIVRHRGSSESDTGYIELGKKSELFSPYILGELWASDIDHNNILSSMFVQAHLLGVRFPETPPEDRFVIKVKVLPNEFVSMDTNTDFYGLGNNHIFCTRNKYKSSPSLSTRSLDRLIVDGIVAYRWFFNRQHLTAKVVLDHDKRLESEASWKSKEDYDCYMATVKLFADSEAEKLEKLINNSIEKKWMRKYKKISHFDPNKINSYRHGIDILE